MKIFSITIVMLVQFFVLSPSFSENLFGNNSKLDQSFCVDHTIRQTVIYVDDTMLVSGQNGWLRSIYEKLTATLVPGERTTLVELSPSTGQSFERWSGCWPAYTSEEMANLTTQRSFFSANPLVALKTQQNLFAHELGVAVENIEKNHARPKEQVVIDQNNPPTQSILRTLVSDGARYSHSQETIRAIFYSDLAENSDLGSIFKPLPQPIADYGTKLGIFLRRSVFYIFGLGTVIKGNGSVQDEIREFWTSAFQSMAANVGGMGTDLNVPNILPVAARNFDVLLENGDSRLSGRLSLLVGKDGTLVDSWLGIVRLHTAALNGTYVCTGLADAPSCTLQADTASGIVTTSPSETVSLSSHDSPKMSGTIGVQGSDVHLPLAADPAKN